MGQESTPHRRQRLRLVALVTVALLGGSTAVQATADEARAPDPSLPSVETGPRPGPEVLYADQPPAPQLENTPPWQADPILVSGTQAYRDGEWLYQDFLFDDHGATGVVDPEDPYGPGTNLYSPTAGTFTYPRDPVYAHNAADLVELRIRPHERETRFRVTLNTLLDAERTAFTLALGDGPDREWPHGAGVSSPARHFLTVHGETAELLDAETGRAIDPAPRATVDMSRRQVEVRVPHEAWDPRHDTVRVTIGVGLWDPGADTYLAPRPGPASATTPGGGLVDGPALVNVGPRFDEPTPQVVGVTMADTAAGARALAPWWRERQQSLQLAQGDLTPFAAEVDFAALARGIEDDSDVPTSGPMDRILASRYEFGQGMDPSKVCFGISSGIDEGPDCIGRYVGQLHPYAVYVPDGPVPDDGWGLTLLLHSLSANYNQYLSTRNQTQLGDRDDGTIVVTPQARGPDGFYKGVAEAAAFEVWADVARHHRLDPSWTTVSGYSMGGYGTYRLLARWPDLFARGFSVVGIPGTASDQLASLRHTPVLAWNAGADELVTVDAAEQAHTDLVEAGIDHTYDLFPTADHLTLAGNDEYGPGAAFLGAHRVVGDPATVTYVIDPREDSTDVVADHAYWLSELRVRDPEAAPTGTIEVHSGGFGVDRGGTTTVEEGGGVLTGGNLPALSYVERGLDRSDPERAPTADRLEVTAANVSHVTVDPIRARVSCDAEVVVDSDGPIEVELAGCDPEGGTPDDRAPAGTPRTSEPVAGTALPATGGGVGLGIVLLLALAGRPRTRTC